MNLLSFAYDNLFSLGRGKIDLTKRGLTLVTGYSEDEKGFNGSGKSSLANKGIIWTLFGETVGGIKADAAINRHGPKKCRGEIRFIGCDGKEYSIHRERPAKLSLYSVASEPGGRALGFDISAATAKATQEMIDQLLGFNFQTFVQTSFFGQGRQMHYPSLPPKDQKAVLEAILPMADADRWADYADKVIKATMPEVKANEAEFHRVKSKVDTLIEQMNKTQKQGVEFEDNRKYRMDCAKQNIASVRVLFHSELEALEKLRIRVSKVDPERYPIEIEKFRLKVAEYVKAKDENSEKYTEAAAVKEQWELRYFEYRNRLANYAKQKACPQCQRPYETDDLERDQRERMELELTTTEAKERWEQAKEACDYYRKHMQAAVAYGTTAMNEMQTLMRELDEYKSFALEDAKLNAKIEKRTAQDRAELAMLESSVNPHLETFHRLQKEIAEVSAEEILVTKRGDELKEEMEHLNFWKQVFGRDIKLKLFEDACPFLDSRTQYHLTRLKNEQIHVEFATIKRLASGEVKEEFTVNCWSETGGKGFDSLSGGEQQMTSFAIGLALADLAARVNGAKSGFLILDEPFTELDTRNGEAVVEYLTNEVEQGKDTILLISNDEALKGLVSNRIHVVKRKGVTHVGA